jgi:hypothetical protein
MNRACVQTVCVSYWKWCESKVERITCYYSTDDRAIAPWLTVSAPNRNAYAAVERSLGILAGSDEVFVALSALDVESTQRIPPFCRRSGRGPQCPAQSRDNGRFPPQIGRIAAPTIRPIADSK